MVSLALFIQPTILTKNHYRLTQFENIVIEEGVNLARTAGYFTNDIVNNMTTAISDTFDIPVSDITVNVTRSPKYKKNTYDPRERIEYSISVPYGKLLKGNDIYGISDSDNLGIATISGSVQSELLAPWYGLFYSVE